MTNQITQFSKHSKQKSNLFFDSVTMLRIKALNYARIYFLD